MYLNNKNPIDDLLSIRNNENLVEEEAKRNYEESKKLFEYLYRTFRLEFIGINDININEYDFEYRDTIKMAIYKYPFIEDVEVLVDYKLLPENIEEVKYLDIMLLSVVTKNYRIDRNSFKRTYLIGIPSPIKLEYEMEWDNIIKAYNEHSMIKTKIKDIDDNYLILNIGCEQEAILHIKTKYLKKKNIGEEIFIGIKSFVDDNYGFTYGSKEFYKKLKITAYLPDYYELKKEYIKDIILKNNDKIYMLDTNVIINYPELINYLLECEKKVKFAYNVIEELDGLKKNENKEIAKKARNGLKIINDFIEQIELEEPERKNMPQGLGKKNDNDIISAAKKYGENVLLVTDDLGVIVKAKALKIGVWNCSKDFE